MSASEEKCDTEKIVPRADQADLRFGCARLQDESGAPRVRPRRRRTRLRPKRRRDRHRNAGDDARPEGLGCPPSGVRVSQHVKGGWATSLLTDAFLPRILTSFSLCGCSRTAIRRRDPTGSVGFSHTSHKNPAGREPSKSSREHHAENRPSLSRLFLHLLQPRFSLINDVVGDTSTRGRI